MRRLRNIWRNLWHRERVDAALEDELRATFDLLVDEKLRAGVRRDAAEYAARVELGSTAAVAQQVREVRAGALLDELVQDVSYTLRVLRRHPLFALTAIASMAVGIAAPTAIFTIANGVLLRPAPGVADPSTLVDIVRLQRGDEVGVEEISYPDYLDVRARVTTLQHVYGYRLQPDSVSLVADDITQRVFATLATTNYFEALGVRAAAGRLFGRGDSEREGASPVAVLSHRLWMTRFGGSPSIVGRSVRVNGQSYVVVGVADEAFRGTTVVAPDLWIPATMVGAVLADASVSPLRSRADGWLMLGGRLKGSASRTQASAEVAAIGDALAREFPVPPHERPPHLQNVVYDWSVEAATPIPAGLRIIVATLLGFLTALVSVVLVIACANVAGILLTRGAVRRREIAVRAAVGAGRRRLVRQLLTESALLMMAGGIAGLFLAQQLTSALLLLLPAFPVPINVATPLDGRVLGFSFVLSAVAALLTGLAPALHGARTDVVAALKDDVPAGTERIRLRHAFVVAQVAFSVLLVVVAAALVRGLDRIAIPDSGFDERGVDVATIDLTLGGYSGSSGRLLIRELAERVRSLPGVDSSTIASLPGNLTFGGVSVPGVAPPDGAPFFYPNWTLVEPGYFATLGVPLVAGRDFDAADREGGEPVAIVSESTARRLWPGTDPIGQVMRVHRSAPDGSAMQPLRVIGIARDIAPPVPGSAPRRVGAGELTLYVPLQQHSVPQLRILTRSRGGRSLAEDLRAVVASVDPDLPVLSAQPLENQRAPIETQLRIAAIVAVSVGAVGVLLATIGVYGVTAYLVTRRTREIGIRLSLGADRMAVIRLVLHQGMRPVAIGAVIGMLMAAAAGALLQRTPVPPPDLPLFAATALFFAIIGVIACYVPVRRATSIRAMDALRCE